MAKVSHIAGRAAGSIAAGTTNYFLLYGGSTLLLGTEALAARTIRTAGVYAGLYVRISANTLTGSCVVTFRKNGADGNQGFTITTGQVGQFHDTTNTDSVVATDTACVSAACAAGGTSISLIQFGFTFDATSNTVYTSGCGQSGFYTASATKNYVRWSSSALIQGTETGVLQLRSRIAGTIKNFGALTTTNARTTTTTVGNRLNGADGAGVVSVSAGVTGFSEDTTHTNAVVSGDLLNRYVLGGASTENFLTNQFSEFESTAGEVQYMAAGAQTLSASTTRYDHINGASVMTATEADTKRPLQFAGRITNGQIYVSANAASGGNSLLTLRKNGVDTAFVVTVSASGTGIFEFSGTPVDFLATDEINWKWVTASGGNVTTDWTSLVVGPTPSGDNFRAQSASRFRLPSNNTRP